MNIIIGTLIIWVIAAILWQRLETQDQRTNAIMAALESLRVNLPKVIVALIGAGFFAALLPEGAIAKNLGASAGGQAIWIAVLFGILTPGGMFVSFALASAALEAGASVPAMMAYLAAWALLSFTKVIADELAFMGARFLLMRLVVAWPLPIVIGYSALAIGL